MVVASWDQSWGQEGLAGDCQGAVKGLAVAEVAWSKQSQVGLCVLGKQLGRLENHSSDQGEGRP